MCFRANIKSWNVVSLQNSRGRGGKITCCTRGWLVYSYTETLVSRGAVLAPLAPPAPPLAGWELVSDSNVDSLAASIPSVTSGKNILCILKKIIVPHYIVGTLYTYLACGSGQSPTQGAFRALPVTRGFNHWASGCLSQVRLFLHVKVTNYMRYIFINICLLLNTYEQGTHN